MIIYPLPPTELDDVTLSRQIKNIALVLCEIHYGNNIKLAIENKLPEQLLDIPLERGKACQLDKFARWGEMCRANYLKLVEMGCQCCVEWMERFKELPVGFRSKLNSHKFQPVIEWAHENVPDLAELDLTLFPLLIPDNYKLWLPMGISNDGNKYIINCYRNYYRAKIKDKGISFTRRVPEWLNDL